MGVLKTLALSGAVLVPLAVGAQQYTLQPDDLKPRQDYTGAMPTFQELTQPKRIDAYRAMAAEINRQSQAETSRAIAAKGQQMGLPADGLTLTERQERAPGIAAFPAGYRVSILVSKAMGEGALKDLLARYRDRKDVRFVFRGVPAGMTVPTFAYWLTQLAGKEGEEITDLNIVLDPELFSQAKAVLAPTMVLEDLQKAVPGTTVDMGAIVARAVGYTDPDWLFAEFQSGDTELSGGAAVEVEEEDLRARAEREAAQVASRLTRDPKVIRQRFWDRQAHALHMMQVRPAAVDRTRELHFLARAAEPIRDHKGKILAFQGEVFQPSDVAPFDRRIFAFNPNRPREVEFVAEALASPRGAVVKTMLVLTELPVVAAGREPWAGIQDLVDRFHMQVFLLNDQFRSAFSVEASPTEIYPARVGSGLRVFNTEYALE